MLMTENAIIVLKKYLQEHASLVHIFLQCNACLVHTQFLPVPDELDVHYHHIYVCSKLCDKRQRLYMVVSIKVMNTLTGKLFILKNEYTLTSMNADPNAISHCLSKLYF